MPGIKNLTRLLKEMNPIVAKEEYVFCTLAENEIDWLKLKPLMIFKEKEGLTLILEKKVAEANSLAYSGVWSWITLAVHSDLEAVGFLAKITNRLAAAGLSVNVVSAYYHDHLFVPAHLITKAKQILEELSKS